MDKRTKVFVAVGAIGAGIAGYCWYQKRCAGAAATATSSVAGSSTLSATEFRPFTLQSIRKYNHNTSIFRFKLDSIAGSDENSLPVASYLLAKETVGETDLIRPYTPIDADCSSGYFDLMIKHYLGGKMSPVLHSKHVGDTVLFKGPMPKFAYQPNTKKQIGMIAGGTGITPMLQVIHKVLGNPADKTKISLLFANVSENDILLKEELDRLALDHPDRFEVHYTVDKEPSTAVLWKHDVGFVSDGMVKSCMPKPGPDSLVLVCGPPKMMDLVSGQKNPDFTQGELRGILKKLGYGSDQVYKY